MSDVAATGMPVSAGVEGGQSSRPPGHGVPVHVAILTHTSRDDHRARVGVWDGAGRPEVFIQTLALVGTFSTHQVSRTRSNPVSTLPSCLTISVVFLLDPPPISTSPASEAQDTWSYLRKVVHVPGYMWPGHVVVPLLQQICRRLPLARGCVEGEAGGAGEVAAAEEAALLAVHVALVGQLWNQKARAPRKEELC